MKPYPLIFEPILKEKVWGGRRLERLGKSLPEGAMIGESWELADLAGTSTDGGGDAARSVIANGPMRGVTLADAIRAMGPNLMGVLHLSADGGFPLLVKFLDARENLSVQVHPSPAYAKANPGAHLKTESWYIIDAEPGAKIYKGVREGVTRDTFEAHIRDNTVINDMIAIPARPGDFHHLPSGTCHALGAGVLVAEVQTPSDTTYRVYDWGRSGRALHLEQALECIDYRPASPESFVAAHSATRARCPLVHTEFYELAEVRAADGDPLDAPAAAGSPTIWMVLRGGVEITSPLGHFEPVAAPTGATLLLPAALGPALARAQGETVLLEAQLPTT